VNDQFESLRRLLALKRHECPPPGHFDRLADRIHTKLQAGLGAVAPTWWERLVAQFDIRPAFATALALAVGAAYFYGWSWSHVVEAQAVGPRAPSSTPWMMASQVPWPAVAAEHELDSRLPALASRSSVHPIMGMEPDRGWLSPVSTDRAGQVQPLDFRVRQR